MQEYLKSVPPSLACFSREETDTIVYTGYGLHKYIQLYSITQGKVCVLLTYDMVMWCCRQIANPHKSAIVNEDLAKN